MVHTSIRQTDFRLQTLSSEFSRPTTTDLSNFASSKDYNLFKNSLDAQYLKENVIHE